MDASAVPSLLVSADVVPLNTNGGTYPRMCRLSDGSILMGFTAFEPNPDNAKVPFRILRVHRSTNNGATFQPHGVVSDRSPRDCDNLFLLEVPKSSSQSPIVLAAFRNHDVDAEGVQTYYRITVCQSPNGGRDWTYLSQAFEKSTAPYGLWEPFMWLGRDGHVKMTFSQELSPTDQDTMFLTSPDQGRTWSRPQPVTGVGESLRDGMTGVVRTTDHGRNVLVMVFETTRHDRHFSIECVLSYDEGASWDHRQLVYEPSPRGRANAGSPQIEALDKGCLAVVFMTDEDSLDSQLSWPKSASVKAVFGSPPVDGRIRWNSLAQTIHNPSSLWPAIFKVDESKLMAMYQHESGIVGRYLVWKS